MLLAQTDVEQGSRELAFRFGKHFTAFPQNLPGIVLTCTCLERQLTQSSIWVCKMNFNMQNESLYQYCKVNHCNLWQPLCFFEVAQEKLAVFTICFKVLLRDSVELHKNEVELHSWRALVLQKEASTPTVIATWAVQTKILLKKITLTPNLNSTGT